jgi:hypothetical protein
MEIKHARWVVILTGLQPVLFDISYACLAEAPAALLIALSYWYHLKGRPGCGLAIASAVFLFRFEMYVFAVLMFFVYLRKREWKILPLVLLGPLIWIGSSAIISGDVMTFFREWSNYSNLGKYVPGVSVTHYVEKPQTILVLQVVPLSRRHPLSEKEERRCWNSLLHNSDQHHRQYACGGGGISLDGQHR